MKKRKLGKVLEVSEIGFGCMGMDHAYGAPADRKQMKELLVEAYSCGCTFFDTAPVYGLSNEILLGDAFRQNRKDVVIATKFGITGQKIVDGKPMNILDSSPESIKLQCEESLKRLRTDYIDLYFQHRVDPKVVPEAVAETVQSLIDEGKILAWGLSNAPEEYLVAVHKICPVSAVENQYSMLWRKPEEGLFKLCKDLDIGFAAYSPLGNGFLTGRFTKTTQYDKSDFRSFMHRFSPEVMDKNQAFLDCIKNFSTFLGCTPAQFVLAWELSREKFLVPIPGTTNQHRLHENLAAGDLVIPKDFLLEINQRLEEIPVDDSYF